jgi:hypothetical protein
MEERPVKRINLEDVFRMPSKASRLSSVANRGSGMESKTWKWQPSFVGPDVYLLDTRRLPPGRNIVVINHAGPSY